MNNINPQASTRIDSINSLLKREISRIITTQVKDPRISNWISITYVETSKDLQKTRVYISVMAEKEETQKTLKALRSATKFIKSNLHKDLSLKRIPNITFIVDDSLEKAETISKLIDSNKP